MFDFCHVGLSACLPAPLLQEYVSLAHSCMQTDPAARPTFTEVVESLLVLLKQSQQLQEQVNDACEKVSGDLTH